MPGLNPWPVGSELICSTPWTNHAKLVENASIQCECFVIVGIFTEVKRRLKTDEMETKVGYMVVRRGWSFSSAMTSKFLLQTKISKQFWTANENFILEKKFVVTYLQNSSDVETYEPKRKTGSTKNTDKNSQY